MNSASAPDPASQGFCPPDLNVIARTHTAAVEQLLGELNAVVTDYDLTSVMRYMLEGDLLVQLLRLGLAPTPEAEQEAERWCERQLATPNDALLAAIWLRGDPEAVAREFRSDAVQLAQKRLWPSGSATQSSSSTDRSRLN